jgi:hypothetical protein
MWHRVEWSKVTKFLLLLGWGETESTWYVGHYLAYCTSPDDDEYGALGGVSGRGKRSTRRKPAGPGPARWEFGD